MSLYGLLITEPQILLYCIINIMQEWLCLWFDHIAAMDSICIWPEYYINSLTKKKKSNVNVTKPVLNILNKTPSLSIPSSFTVIFKKQSCTYSAIDNITCSVISDIFHVCLLRNNTSIWVAQEAWSALPHLKLCDRYSSVESPVHFEGADGAGHPHGHGGVSDDCHTPVHLPLLTKLWCCWWGRAENKSNGVFGIHAAKYRCPHRTVILSWFNICWLLWLYMHSRDKPFTLFTSSVRCQHAQFSSVTRATRYLKGCVKNSNQQNHIFSSCFSR